MNLIDEGEQEQYNLNQFLKNVRKYTDPKILTAEIVTHFILHSHLLNLITFNEASFAWRR